MKRTIPALLSVPALVVLGTSSAAASPQDMSATLESASAAGEAATSVAEAILEAVEAQDQPKD